MYLFICTCSVHAFREYRYRVSSSIGMLKENDPYKEWYLLGGVAL